MTIINIYLWQINPRPNKIAKARNTEIVDGVYNGRIGLELEPKIIGSKFGINSRGKLQEKSKET